MDEHNPARDRVFSILNDNNCPSFVIRPRSISKTLQTSQKSPLSRQERPNLQRQAQYTRTLSFSSAGSPPLLRFDSSSSKASNRSMDSTPSPLTPAYGYNDASLLSYNDGALRQDLNLNGYLPSPTTITPFMEQQLMIAPTMPEQYSSKAMPQIQSSQYPILPAPSHSDNIQLPTPAPSNSTSNSSATLSMTNDTSPTSNTAGNPPVKRNKYPCPYAHSHSCQATFTTSGHAARHGKKHTGEKGVHCPVCNKAFTRKDNMKQHERTHKGSISGSNSDDSVSRRSKAAVTRDLQKNKQFQKQESSSSSDPTRRSSIIHSPLSEVTSLAPTTAESLQLDVQSFYPDPSNSMMIPTQVVPENLSPASLYPPLGDETMLSVTNALPLIQGDKSLDLISGMQMPPTLIRGFSDLDTLAQAAESFDPYYQQTM